MSSISVNPHVSPPTHNVHPTGGTAQHNNTNNNNLNQVTHNGQAVHNGTTHSNASSLGSLPHRQHIGQSVNTTA